MYRGVEIVAEVKTRSPFGFRSEKIWEELFDLANQRGDIVAIHTDPRWGGSFDLLKKARRLTTKPILAKGIHKTDQEVAEALEAGTDWILVVGRLPNIYREKCWISPSKTGRSWKWYRRMSMTTPMTTAFSLVTFMTKVGLPISPLPSRGTTGSVPAGATRATVHRIISYSTKGKKYRTGLTD